MAGSTVVVAVALSLEVVFRSDGAMPVGPWIVWGAVVALLAAVTWQASNP